MELNNLPLAQGKIGIEREMLRTDARGNLAMTGHHEALGKVLTHPNITIDYAESLIEVVTDPIKGPNQVYNQLLELHQYCAQNIGDERLWPASMPCVLPDNIEDIKIGYFGETNAAKMKRLYRKGLGLRYGKSMQMIAGIHFNYSPPANIWQHLAKKDGKALSQDYIDTRYMAMLRNLQRYGWLICYLFGTSPAVDKSFAIKDDTLNNFSTNTLGWEDARTLRMSKLGYQNKSEFSVSLNHLSEYIHDLSTAVQMHSPHFEHLKLKNKKGEYQQISTNILQIENEYYAAARPKQIAKSSELPTRALHERGIEYIELRLLDINPNDPCGVSLSQIHFLETFMLWALLQPADFFNNADSNESNHDRLGIACCGRKKDYTIFHFGKRIKASHLASRLLVEMREVAEKLDEQNESTMYVQAINELITQVGSGKFEMIDDVYQGIKEKGFINSNLEKQEQHLSSLLKPLNADRKRYWDHLVAESEEEFKKIEQKSEVPFDQYLAHYFDSLAGI